MSRPADHVRLAAFDSGFTFERVIRRAALDRGLRAPTYEMAPRADMLVCSQDAPAPICDRILDGGEFALPDELAGMAPRA